MSPTSPVLVTLSVEGLGVIGSLMYFGFKAGRLLEKINSHEQRIQRLENKAFYKGATDE